MYNSDEEFVDDWMKGYIIPNNAINAQSIDEYADKLKAGGYYTASAEHYKSLMRNAPMSSGGSLKIILRCKNKLERLLLMIAYKLVK